MSNISSIFDGNVNAAQGRQGTTVKTFILSLVSGAVLFGVQFLAFTIFRNYLWAKRIYQPRSFLVPLKDRVKPPPNNLIRWAITVYNIQSSSDVLHKAGMDAYFFLRYLAMCLKIFVPAALVILPVLIPVNVVHGKGLNTINGTNYNVTGLDVLAWSNVSPENTSRYWAHWFLAICLIAWVCYLSYKEMAHYVTKRQEYLGSPSHRLKASSTTVLITDIPKELCTTEALTEMYDDFPGGVRRIWINKDYRKLLEKDQQRRHYEDLLENAETELLRKAIKKNRKAAKPLCNEIVRATTPPGQDNEEVKSEEAAAITEKVVMLVTAAECEKDLQHDLATQAVWTKYIDTKQREKMRISKPNRKGAFKIPLVGRFFGEQVDTIYYSRRALASLNEEMERDIDQIDELVSNGSAFIQFNTQKAAHLACQAVADLKPRQMIQRTVEISPADIHWDALDKSWANRGVRIILFLLLMVIVVLVFGIISFFTGILSRLSTLSETTSWLRWIGGLPSWLVSFIQGTVSSVILVLLLSGPTPIVLRAMTNKTRGAITRSQGERSLQYWYFILLLLELFIIPTLSSGLTSIVQEVLQNATSVPNILAENLPTAANYYFSFLVVQALSISGSSICQTVRLFNYYVLGSSNTPDSVFAKLTFTHFTRIGSNIPWYTTFAVIGLVYAVIAPLMLVFVIATFTLFWFIIKNNVLFVVRTGDIDSGALWFPHAITQTFTGIYFMELCLIGLFFLVRDVQGNVACKAQGTLMGIALVVTILYQIWLITNFSSLIKYAPLRLETIAVKQDREYELERLAPEAISEVAGKSPEKQVSDQRPAAQRAYSGTALEKEISLPNLQIHNRDRRHSTRSTFADRSKDLQVQREQDKQRAKHILARLNRPLDEARLASLEAQLAAVEARVGNALIPRSKDIEARMMNDPISKIIMQHNDELEDLTPEERDMLISIAFTHPVLRDSKPCIWIPKDELGISDDEVKRSRALSKYLSIDNRGAFFRKNLKVGIDRAPPDLSEFAFVMQEL